VLLGAVRGGGAAVLAGAGGPGEDVGYKCKYNIKNVLN